MNNISPLAYVHPEAKMGDGNTIGPFCCIWQDTVIGDGNVLLNNVTIHPGARIGSGNEFFPGASISTKPQDLKYKGEASECHIGDGNSIRESVTISRGTAAANGKTVVGSGNLIMENAHVAHDCKVGSHVIIGNSTKLGGEVAVDDHAIISAAALFHQFCHVGGYSMTQGGSRTSQDIPPFITAGKHPVKYCGLNVVGMRRAGFSNDTIDLVHNAYRMLYSKGVLAEGMDLVRRELPQTREVLAILDFVSTSKRGIIR